MNMSAQATAVEETNEQRIQRRKADLMANLEKSTIGLKAQIDSWADKVKSNPIYEFDSCDYIFSVVAKWKLEISMLRSLKSGCSVKSLVDNQESFIINDAEDRVLSTSATHTLFEQSFRVERAKLYNWMKRYV